MMRMIPFQVFEVAPRSQLSPDFAAAKVRGMV